MTVHVFVGPSLSAHRLPDGPVYHPPVAHGDLLEANLRAEDSIVIVDGYFHTRSAIKHKEILAVAGAGTPIFGASSIGALRAAEIPAPWMTGVGEIYTQYSTGMRCRDDDVMLVHDLDPPYAEDSIAFVNWQALLRFARSRDILDQVEATNVASMLHAHHYSQRTFGSLIASKLLEDVQVSELRNLWHSSRADIDVKASDALEAIRTATSVSEERLGPRESSVPDYGHTSFIETWKRELPPKGDDRLSFSKELNYARLFSVEFAEWFTDTLVVELRERHKAYRHLPTENRSSILATQDPRVALAFTEQFVTENYRGWSQLTHEARRAVQFERLLKARLNLRASATIQNTSVVLELLRNATQTTSNDDLEVALQHLGFRTWESAVAAAQPFVAYMQYKMQVEQKVP